MAILLAGDVGGTKTILRLVEARPAPAAREVPELRRLAEETYPSHLYPDLVPMVRHFFGRATAELGAAPAPEAACFGIAGPVVDNSSKVTNLAWRLEGDRLEHELGIPRVRLINDFVAIGHAIPALGVEDLHTLQVGERDREAPIAVIGAGTGLGEAFLIPQADGYRVFANEGGHVDFAPRSKLEFELLSYLREAHHLTHVSVERVVSGNGIASIYEFLRDRDVAAESAEMAAVYKTWKREMGTGEKTADLAAEVSKAAIAGRDDLCRQTMDVFVEVYGVEAGNLALNLLPFGGVYVAGGIAAKILPLLERGAFLEAFKDKGRLAPLLERMPVHIVTNPKVGLIGAALQAARLATAAS